MAEGRRSRETLKGKYRTDLKFRRGLLTKALQRLLVGDCERHPGRSICSLKPDDGGAEGRNPADGSVDWPKYWSAALGREMLRFYINATVGFPELARRTGIHEKTLHQMFGPKGNPTTEKLFRTIACLQWYERVRLRVVE